MHLVPSDSIPQTALRAKLNQETPGRSHHLSFVSDYVGVPQGSQYPGFLPNSRRSIASTIRLRRLENDRLRNIDIIKIPTVSLRRLDWKAKALGAELTSSSWSTESSLITEIWQLEPEPREHIQVKAATAMTA
jgi:hypothetical protein